MTIDKTFDFTLEPNPAYKRIDITKSNYTDIAFTVTNKSGRPLRAEALVIPLDGATSAEGEPLPAEAWGHWLTIVEDPAYDFGPSSVKIYTVRVQLPADLRFGDYHFQLIMVGVDDPDDEYAAGDPVTFTVVGPQMNARNFLLIALAIVVALTLGVVLLVFLLQSAKLNVTLETPTTVAVGEKAIYSVLIENKNTVTATNVVLVYTPPPGIVGAMAFEENAHVRECDKIGDGVPLLIQCDLGVIPPQNGRKLRLEMIPGPGTSVITNTNNVTVTAQLANAVTQTPAKVAQTTTSVTPATGVTVAVEPSAGVATLDEPITYRLLAWTNALSATNPLTITYTLPQGMRYATNGDKGILLPSDCTQQADYFTLICRRTYDPSKALPAEVSVRVVPTVILTTPPEQSVSAQVDAAVPLTPHKVVRSFTTTVVNSALFFNGVNDYVELGYHDAPKDLTVEMWVHPFSSEDGQSFIGAHRPTIPNLNLFLVGYWNDGLNVGVGDTSHVITGTKRVERYHLAVVVKRKSATESFVRVYINGEEQGWREPDPPYEECARCKVFTSTLGSGLTFPWLLGQEWDGNSTEKRASDFFSGTMSDVRIWSYARTGDEIRRTMNQHVLDNDARLIGNWRLEPENDAPNRIVDAGANHYTGSRHGTSWGGNLQRFGGALQFNGVSQRITAPNVRLLSGNAQPNQVHITLAGWLKVDSVPTQAAWITAIPLTLTLGSTFTVAAIPGESSPTSSDQQTTAGTAFNGALPNELFWVALLIDNDGHVAMVAQPNGDQTRKLAFDKDEKALVAGRWHHYAGVVTIANVNTQPVLLVKLYRNGELVKGTLAPPNTRVEAAGCQLGAYIGGPCDPLQPRFFTGRLDEVRIWERALAAPEINNWLNRPGESFDELAYWPFDDGPGRKSVDHSKNHQDVELNGPAWIVSDIGTEQNSALAR